VQRRGARRILIVVALAVVVLLGLAWWVLRVPYEVDLGGRPTDCDVIVRDAPSFYEACDEARDERRTTALLIGAAVATAAAAASTIPSRRLTGEALGPESPDPGA
jgi:hypothetical protein